MSNILKVLITVFIIGLVVMAIIFFSIFGIVPAEKLTRVLKGDTATSTEEKTVIVSTTTIIERIIEREVPVEEEPEEPEEEEAKAEEPEPKPPAQEKPPRFEDKYKYPIRIAGGEFSPSTITVDEGESVVIGLKSDDEEYTIKIPGYGLFQTVAEGGEKIIAFQALSTGEFEIVCEGCKEGFEASLIVE